MWPVEKKMASEKAKRQLAALHKLDLESPVYEATYLAALKQGHDSAACGVIAESAVSAMR